MTIANNDVSRHSAWENEFGKRLDALDKLASEAVDESRIKKLQAQLSEVLDAIVHDVSDFVAANDARKPEISTKISWAARFHQETFQKLPTNPKPGKNFTMNWHSS